MTNSSHTVVAAPVVLKTVYVDRWEKIAKIFTPDCCHIITICTPDCSALSQYSPLQRGGGGHPGRAEPADGGADAAQGGGGGGQRRQDPRHAGELGLAESGSRDPGAPL